MISNVIFSMTGIGQPILMADSAAKVDGRVLIVAPKGVHEQWRRDMRELGVDTSRIDLVSPHRIVFDDPAKGLAEYAHIFVDDLDPTQLVGIAHALRETDVPVTLRVNEATYIQNALKLERSEEDAARRIYETLGGKQENGAYYAEVSLSSFERLKQFPADFAPSLFLRSDATVVGDRQIEEYSPDELMAEKAFCEWWLNGPGRAQREHKATDFEVSLHQINTEISKRSTHNPTPAKGANDNAPTVH